MSIRNSKEKHVRIVGFQLGYPRSRYHSLSVKIWKSDPKTSVESIGLQRSAVQKVEECRFTV